MNGKYITLKPLAEEDFIIVTQWNFDPKVTEFFTERDKPTLIKQRAWFEKQLEAIDKEKYTITCNLKKTKIGIISLMKIDLINLNCELGITIGNTDYWGKPHAKEALHLLLVYGFSTLKLHVIYLTVFETNKRAVKFFEKCGFRKDGIQRDMVLKKNSFISLLQMSITNTEYLNN